MVEACQSIVCVQSFNACSGQFRQNAYICSLDELELHALCKGLVQSTLSLQQNNTGPCLLAFLTLSTHKTFYTRSHTFNQRTQYMLPPASEDSPVPPDAPCPNPLDRVLYAVC